jgi:hypothetical protein
MHRLASLAIPLVLSLTVHAGEHDTESFVDAISAYSTPTGPISFCVECELFTGSATIAYVQRIDTHDFSVLLISPQTKIPFARFTNKRFFIYDVIKNTIVSGPPVSASITLKYENEKASFNFGLSVDTDRPKCALDIDLVSFLADCDQDTTSKSKLGVTAFGYPSSAKDKVFIWRFIQDSDTRLDSLYIAKTPENAFVLRIYEFTNADSVISLPEVAISKAPLTITTLTNPTSSMSAMSHIGRLMETCSTYPAANNPAMWNHDVFSPDTDWNMVKKRTDTNEQSVADWLYPEWKKAR